MLKGKIDNNRMLQAVSVIAGITVNFIPAYLMHRFSLPLYFDTAGTIFCAALAGSLPGIVTAVATSILCTAFNSYSIYYTLIGILIAIVTAFFMRNKLFEKRKNVLLYLLILAVIGGCIGTVFQWVLFGKPQFSDVENLAERFSDGSGAGFFFFSALINTGLNFLDKSLAAGLAFLVLHFVPPQRRIAIINCSWMQKPLTEQEIAELNRSPKGSGISVKDRLTGLLILASVLMALVMAASGLAFYSMNLKKEYRENAIKATELAKKVINADRIQDYLLSKKPISDYEDPEYRRTYELLCAIRESIIGIEYLYVYQIREDGCHIVFDTDPEIYNIGTHINDIEPFDESFLPYLPTLLAGERMEPLENDDRFGYFITNYEPLYDSQGECVAYVGADASLDFMQSYMRDFSFRVLLVFSGFFVLILSSGLWISMRYLVYPIKSLAVMVTGFDPENADQEILDQNTKKIASLDIKTKDEVEQLYHALCRMTEGTAEQMRRVRHYAQISSEMQNGLIITMADMVENRDSDTGAHVQKTSAYVRIILNGLKRKGYYLNKLTPQYMSDVETSAPLHDVGKISIPDAILNKPGKLDDEEFAIMKTHTTEGMRIIDKAIERVRGGEYLKEARNMAAYHHERWDGKGYPEGLAGEVIPLSARVMAVADVFDALASPRVYKPAFPLEKALDIISEGAGTQFDPKCVEVFMDSLDEVKAVLKKYHG